MSTDISSQLEQYADYINTNEKYNIDLLFVNSEFTDNELYRGLLAHLVLEDLSNTPSQFPYDARDLSTFDTDSLVLRWFKSYYPEYPEHLYAYDGLDEYIGNIQDKYNYFSIISNGRLCFKIIDKTYIKPIDRACLVYMEPNQRLYSKLENSRFVIMPEQLLILECLKYQNFEMLANTINRPHFKEFFKHFANMCWYESPHSNKDLISSKLDSLKLNCILNGLDYRLVSVDKLRLPIELGLSLQEVFDIHQTSLVPVEPISYPNIDF